MSRKYERPPEWATAFPDLYTVYADFILSREAISCTERTVYWYRETLGAVMDWMVHHGVARAPDLHARFVREYLTELMRKDLSDNYIHNHARVIRTFVKFLYAENYIAEPIKFQMPTIEKQRLLCPTVEDLAKIIKACECARDKAMVLTFADTGVRAAEALALNWGDIDIATGLVHIARGKGGKPRSVVIGVTTRRALLAYRRELNPEEHEPLFQTVDRQRLRVMGLRSIFQRLEKRSGVEVTPHALRRFFATMAWRGGMDPLQLQAFLGHTTLIMVNRYIQMVDDDLVVAHKAHGPIDHILRKR